MKCHSNWAIDILKRSGSIVKIFFRFTYRYGLRSCFIWYLVSGKAFILKEILGCNELGHFQIIVMMVGAVQQKLDLFKKSVELVDEVSHRIIKMYDRAQKVTEDMDRKVILVYLSNNATYFDHYPCSKGFSFPLRKWKVVDHTCCGLSLFCLSSTFLLLHTTTYYIHYQSIVTYLLTRTRTR